MTTGTSMALQDQVRRVALLRLAQDRLAVVVANARTEWEAAHETELNALANTKVELGAEERRLRDLTVSEFQATGELKPAPGVSIRRTTELDYTEADAFTWAKQSNMALALDRKAFEAIAKATDLPFVTKREVPQATIATKLPVSFDELPAESEVSA